MNTGNAIKNFGAGGLEVTRAVPEKHIINFFWPNIQKMQAAPTQISLYWAEELAFILPEK